MHFILVNLYGQPYTATGALETKAVPLKLNTDLEEIPSRNTVKEIYTSILSDIETARKLINKKEWEIQYSYRFSTLSVDAMESRVYLYMGEWSKSYEASERILAGKSTLVNLNDEGGKLPNEFTSVEMITAYEVFQIAIMPDHSYFTLHFYKNMRKEKIYVQTSIIKQIKMEIILPSKVVNLNSNVLSAPESFI